MLHRYSTLILAFLLVLLSGCSGTTFFYNRLDFFIPWYLDDYVELNRIQKTSLDELLQPYLKWHREEELPRYLSTLLEIEQSLDTEAQVENIEQFSRQFEAAWERLETASLQWMIALGDQLSDEQIKEFLDSLQKQQKEYEEEFLSRTEDEYFDESYDNLLDSFQDYLGRLDKPQRRVLKDATVGFQRFDAAWLIERAAWLTRLEELLRREPGWQERLLQAIAQRDEQSSKDYLARYEHNVALVQRSIADILNSRSSKQDRRLRKKLKHFREDLTVLIDKRA